MSLPTIDLAELERAPSGEHWNRLQKAARADGAFLLLGHGLPAPATSALLAGCRAFFALPQGERDAIDMLRSPYFRGYSAPGTERTQGRPDAREQFDLGPEEAPSTIRAGNAPWQRLRGPNLWPAAQPELRPVILDWMQRSRAIATRTIDAIVRSIGRSPEPLSAGFTGTPYERLKVIRYPPAGANDPQGVGEHSDSGFITLIVDDGSRGLQVEHGTSFADVVVPPGTLIVILGRALRDATGGATHAVTHRVVSTEQSGERISVAYFLNPRLDFAGYGDEALRVLFRSHPHVAQRYFADLLPAAH